ncbi:MAG: T9SS type A sorting domain-containing protein, partial [Bacteroidota bacterium]|nr:T9SS type A sorting domain-containing protein [Bacteroidota bacterium]
TGVVDEFQGNTQLILLPFPAEITDLTPFEVEPEVLPISYFSKLNESTATNEIQFTTGETYEGMYVEFRDVRVVNVQQSGGRYFWSIQDSAGNAISIRDVSSLVRNDGLADSIPHDNNFLPPTETSLLAYLRGIIVNYTLGGVPLFGVAPLKDGDIGPLTSSPPAVRSLKRVPALAKSTAPVTIRAYITDDKDSVVNAKLFYSVGIDNKNFQQVVMTQIANDTFVANIPAQANGSFVNYWVWAVDNNDRTVFYPDSLSTGRMYVIKDEGIDEISDIQYTPQATGISLFNGDTLTNMSIHAIVTAARGPYDLNIIVVQDANKPWSAIMIKGTSSISLDDLERGDSILITSASVREDFNVTVLENTTITILANDRPVPAPVTGLPIDSIRLGKTAYSEAYESMLLEFNNIIVIDTNADHTAGSNFGEFEVGYDASFPGLRADDLSADIPSNFNTDSLALNDTLGYLRGILFYSFGNWKLLPRNRTDIEGFMTPTDTVTSIHERIQIPVVIYPNPAASHVQVKGASPFHVEIIDLSGKVIYRSVAMQSSFNISLEGWTKGLYLVKMSNNQATSTSRLIIQ